MERKREAGARLKSLVLWVPDAEREILIAQLWEEGTTGITEAANSLRAFFENDVDMEAFRTRFAQYEPDVIEEEDRDWVAESQAQWPPTAVGERFYLVPEWRDDPAPCGRIRLRTFPGMACGSGTHPATQLCLVAMEQWVQAEDSLLDAGTGSGILAQAAHLLGAKQVFGCDIDHAATEIARRNSQEFIYQIPFFTGSLRSVRTGAVSLIVANLNAETLRNLAADMKRVCTRALIVAGFRTDELARVEQALGQSVQRYEQEGWACAVIPIRTV